MPAIVTVTSAYYTTGSDPNGAWTDEALAWDSTITGATGAWVSNSTKGESNTAKNLYSSGNNLSTVAGDPITKVEIGYRGKIWNTNEVVYIQPVFGGATYGDPIMIDPVTTVMQNLYADITTVAGAPATWTRQAIADLDINLYAYSSATTASASTFTVDAVLIRVTETSGIPNALAYYTKSTQTDDMILDDTFDNSSVGTTWTKSTYDGCSINETTCLTAIVTSGSYYLPATTATPEISRIYQNIPTGNFSIVLKALKGEGSTKYNIPGVALCLIYSTAWNTPTATKYIILRSALAGAYGTTGCFWTTPDLTYNSTRFGTWSVPMSMISGNRVLPSSKTLYLNMRRSGSTANFYYSTNGTTWTDVGSTLAISTKAGQLSVGFACLSDITGSTSPSTFYVAAIYDLEATIETTTTIGIYESTANMTKALPVYVSNKQGYIRLEPTADYAGDKGTRLRLRAEDGVTYTVCATTS